MLLSYKINWQSKNRSNNYTYKWPKESFHKSFYLPPFKNAPNQTCHYTRKNHSDNRLFPSIYHFSIIIYQLKFVKYCIFLKFNYIINNINELITSLLFCMYLIPIIIFIKLATSSSL